MNDHVFKFCQNCGYARRCVHTAVSRAVSFDLPAIDLRISSLQSASLSSAYSRQKQSLKAELEGFLYAVPGNKSLFDATPLMFAAIWFSRTQKVKPKSIT